MQKEEIKKLGENHADVLFKRDSHSAIEVPVSSLWNDRKHNFIAEFNEGYAAQNKQIEVLLKEIESLKSIIELQSNQMLNLQDIIDGNNFTVKTIT